MTRKRSQRQTAFDLLAGGGILRLSEFRDAGVTADTVCRMEREGDVARLARGLYQLPDAPLDVNHGLAQTAKRFPKAVICLVSALVFHDITEQIPRKEWIAISRTGWAPKSSDMPVWAVRFSDALLAEDVETHVVEGVQVRVFSVAATIADCFRHRNKVGLDVALQGLHRALRHRKASPAEISDAARARGAGTVLRPYMQALVADAQPEKNLGAQVRRRLLDISRQSGRNTNLVRQRFVVERLLFRLADSPCNHGFVLKGAMLPAVWRDNPFRGTRDTDLAGPGESSESAMLMKFRDILPRDGKDGVEFDLKELQARPIREGQE